MPTIRGFVERLEVGRAGLVVAGLQHDDGSRADYQLRDLDADPERFNERLSKLGLLRDAMTRAEPVEIEYATDKEGGARQIDRVVRITRDMLAASIELQRVNGQVVGVAVFANNTTGARAELSDTATVALLGDDGQIRKFVLELQMAERAVAQSILASIEEAQHAGSPIILVVNAKQARIVGVEVGDVDAGPLSGEAEAVDGFVESITCAPGAVALGGTALVRFTTAPPFAGSGNIVELMAFTPALRKFLVVEGSHEYELFMAGLRDKLRMRVLAGAAVAGDRGKLPRTFGNEATFVMASDAKAGGPATKVPAAAADTEIEVEPPRLVRGAQLLASLASMSRPVWIQVSRQSLDEGPEGFRCTEGLPSSDLRPQTLRDLRIPYSAEWIGHGCFNHGVYRFQLEVGVDFTITVDGTELCVHASVDKKTRFAHACLDGEHEVRVVLHRWTCDELFLMDVYRIR